MMIIKVIDTTNIRLLLGILFGDHFLGETTGVSMYSETVSNWLSISSMHELFLIL